MPDAFAGHPNVAQVRGEGPMCAVEFAETKIPLGFFDPGRKIGYAISAAMPQGDIIGFAPPLCISKDKVDHVISAAKEAVAEVLG